MSMPLPPQFGGNTAANGIEGGPSREQIAFMQGLMESCPVKVGMAGVAGFGLGGLFGMFMSSFESHAGNEAYLKMTTREQIKFTFKDMGSRSWGSAKNFGKIGAIYSGTECLIESYRAKTDMYNPIVAGCVTGGILAANAGPQAILMGCGSFAAFSAAIEYWMKESDFANQ